MDLPDPGNESLAKLYSLEFYKMASRRLSEEGLMVTQATSPYFSNNTFWTIVQTMDEADLITYPYHTQVPSFGEWGFVIGARNNLLETNRPLPTSTRFLSQDTLSLLYFFDKDTERQKTELSPNSLLYPTLLETYNEDAKRWQP